MGTVTNFHIDDATPCHWLSGYQCPHLVTQCHIPEDLILSNSCVRISYLTHSMLFSDRHKEVTQLFHL